MTKILWTVACLAAMAEVGFSADAPPALEISNGLIHARLYLPDAHAGFYRGTRFDWSGIIVDVEYADHNFYPQWFQRTDRKVRDFVYAGPDIVAGPCTAVTGPAEEFVKALGFDDATAGGTFIKIGVGVLRKPDEAKYDAFRLYEIVDAGQWMIRQSPDAVEFRQELSDPATGYAYEYRKTVSVTRDRAQLVLGHSLRNTGKRPIQTSVYNHNFLYLDRQPPGPDISVTVPFLIQTAQAPDKRLVDVDGKQIRFAKTLSGEDRLYIGILGFSADPKDYDFRIENRKIGAGVRITADRPLSRAALWAIRAPVSLEPFIDMAIEPGAEFTWRITYDFDTLTLR